MALPLDHRHRKVAIQPIRERDATPIEEIPIEPGTEGHARLVIEQVNRLIQEHNES